MSFSLRAHAQRDDALIYPKLQRLLGGGTSGAHAHAGGDAWPPKVGVHCCMVRHSFQNRQYEKSIDRSDNRYKNRSIVIERPCYIVSRESRSLPRTERIRARPNLGGGGGGGGGGAIIPRQCIERCMRAR